MTGGNSGTGYATCRAFYDCGAKVYMASRSGSKAKDAIEKIHKGHDLGFGNSVLANARKHDSGPKGEVHYIEIDLTDLDSIDKFVHEIKR